MRLDIPARPDWFGPVRLLLLGLCRRLGFDDRDAGQIALAADEALCNIHRHGYEGDEDGRIEITLTVNGENERWLEIVMEDRGLQVDPKVIRSRPLDEVRPGGLGVHLIQSVMDASRWDQREGGGMRLTLMKRIDSQCQATGA
jgi:anti-sigma regulatory factor (Ser/Thr protein kinase)